MSNTKWPPAVGTWHRYTLDKAQLRRAGIDTKVAGMECQIAANRYGGVRWVLTEHGWACNADDLILYPLQESET
jgi:hypothetical protein